MERGVATKAKGTATAMIAIADATIIVPVDNPLPNEEATVNKCLPVVAEAITMTIALVAVPDHQIMEDATRTITDVEVAVLIAAIYLSQMLTSPVDMVEKFPTFNSCYCKKSIETL